MLPHEARCHGIGCVIRGDCLRYLHRLETSKRTPFYTRQPENIGNCPMFKASPDQRIVSTNPIGLTYDI